MLLATLLPLLAQQSPRSTPLLPATNSPAGYASEVGVVLDAQNQALDQARQILAGGGETRDRAALEAAVKEMEQSRAALEKARKSPDQLPVALAAEQAAYQSLLKAIPPEHRMTSSRNNNRGSGGGGAGQPSQQEMDQLELTREANRYETESQANPAPTPQQREQSQTEDRLKQLARRQQDLNDRLRDLQTALREARTDQEREEIQRQLKRLRDEQRQMLSDVDEMRQRMEQSSDASRQAAARQQLDRTRGDMQRAAQELESQSVSEALAAGSRAEENLQNLRENLRQQSSSQFAEQMRQMRTQARELSAREESIARDLDNLNNSAQKTLDDSAQRNSLAGQLTRQQGALTNLLGAMRAVTEQAETTEPLLSKQLYDLLRQADLSHADNQLEMGARLVDRGFLPQAGEAERAARQNIDQLRQGVDRAAESVLGSEADALRFARKELDDLAAQLAREMAVGTNSAEGPGIPPQNSNQSQRSGNSAPGQGSPGAQDRQAANAAGGDGGRDRLRQIAQQLGGGRGGLGLNGPITGADYLDWSDRLRDVEQAVDSQDVRNQLATARERVGAYRRDFRQNGRVPSSEDLQNKALAPLLLARDWVQQELSRAQDDRSLVPLDRDPVQDKFSEAVRKYYEKLASPQ